MSSPLPPRPPDWRTRLRRAFFAPITPGALRSVVFLFVLTLALGAANLLWTARYVATNNHKWCATIVTLDNADRRAPPPKTGYGRQLVADFRQLRRGLGCG